MLNVRRSVPSYVHTENHKFCLIQQDSHVIVSGEHTETHENTEYLDNSPNNYVDNKLRTLPIYSLNQHKLELLLY